MFGKNKEQMLATIQRHTKQIESDIIFKLRYQIGYLKRSLARTKKDTDRAIIMAAENAKLPRDDRPYGICDSFEHADNYRKDITELELKIIRLIEQANTIRIQILDINHDVLAPILTHCDDSHRIWLTRTPDGWNVDGTEFVIPFEIINNYQTVSILQHIKEENL